MSSDIPTYQGRTNNLLKIISYFTLHQEVPQHGLDKIIGCSYRTIIRELQTLHSLGYIQLARSRSSGTKGKARNVWVPRFRTLLLGWYLFEDDEDAQDEIARIHKNTWSIFHEWDYLAINSEIQEHVRFCINRSRHAEGFRDNHSIGSFFYSFSGKVNIPYDHAEETDNFTKNRMEVAALGLDNLYGDWDWHYHDGKWVEQEDYLKEKGFKYLDYFMENSNLKSIIISYLRLSEMKYLRTRRIFSRYRILPDPNFT